MTRIPTKSASLAPSKRSAPAKPSPKPVKGLPRDEMSTGQGKSLRLKLGKGLSVFTGSKVSTKVHDLVVASKLKGAVREVLMRVRFGRPLAAADAPKPGPGGRMVAPNGDPLIRVKLSDGGGIPGSSEYALVNPRTNDFYKETNGGGFVNPREYHGPMALPDSAHFKGKKFSEGELKGFEKAANAPPKKLTTRALQAALEKHLKLGDLRFDWPAPDKANIASETVLKHDHLFTWTALALKDDPTHIVIKKVLTGGFVPAGPNDGAYSQPIEVG